MNAEDLIRELNLTPHPLEGGYFRETYRSQERLDRAGSTVDGGKNLCTAIYYLLTPETFSALHRLSTDEIFHFYLGDPVDLTLLHPDGRSETLVLGTDIASGQRPQITVPARCWQGSRLRSSGRFALLGTTVSPGFEFSDLELGKREDLLSAYPEARESILHLTRTRPPV